MTFKFRNQLAPALEVRMRNLYKALSEKDRRRFLAFQSQQLGHGSMAYLSDVLGCSRRTIERGVEELNQLLQEPAPDRVRRAGGGRKKDQCAQ